MVKLIPSPRKHDIAFSHNGRIDIMARVAHILDLHKGDAINIAHIDGEYYLFVQARSENIMGRGFRAICYPSARNSANFRVRSAALARAIIRAGAAENTLKKVSYWCGAPVTLPDGKKALPIITHHNIAQ